MTASTAESGPARHIMSFNGPEEHGFANESTLNLLESLGGLASKASTGMGISQKQGAEPYTAEPYQQADEAMAARIAGFKREHIAKLNPRHEPPILATSTVQGMEKWSAVVTEVDSDYFTAEIISETGSGAPLEADFSISAISPEDSDLLAVGAGFYVTVRTVLDHHARAFRTSALRFRRLGVWSAEEIAEIDSASKARAARLRDAID